jgi:hypothetical protein
VLKPVAPRLAETSWPARSRFARGAGVVDGAEKTPESDEGSTPVGAAVNTLASPGEGALSEIGPDYRVAGVAGASPTAIESDESDDQEKRDRHDKRLTVAQHAEESLGRDIPVPTAKQDLHDAAVPLPPVKEHLAEARLL